MNEIEKQFFDTFGIKPRSYLLCTSCWDCIDAQPCEQCHYGKLIEDEYPKITDRILLELICLLADLYSSNSHGYPLLSKDIKELKEDVLDDLMGAIDVENDYPEGYANKVRTLFEEVNV